MAAKPFDPTVKTLVETSPEDWPVLANLPTGPTEVIDADIATVSGAGDKVLRVRAVPTYLLHLEFQSGHDSADLPEDMHLRSALLRKRHRMPVRSVAVILRPEADSPTLTGLWQVGFSGEEPYDRFRYRVIRVWQLPPDQLLEGGVGTLPLAPISAVTEAELPDIIHRMERRLGSRPLRKFAEATWAATFILLGLRYSPDFGRILLRGVRSMKESTTYQAILEEGRDEGRMQGALTEARRLVRQQGEDLFGVPDERSAAILEGIADLTQLEQLLRESRRCQSWEELLRGFTTRRRARRRP